MSESLRAAPLPETEPPSGHVRDEAAEVRTIGRYVVGDVIAADATAERLRGRDPEHGCDVVLERLTFDKHDVAAHAKALHDARALTMIEHGNIVSLDLVYDATSVTLVTRMVAGEPLPKYLSHRKGKRVELLPLLRQLAVAVAALHAAGCIHGHLEARDVVVDARGQVWLRDLGWWRRHLRTSSELATDDERAWAPERYEGKAADQHSDQYALGLVLWEALAEELPFGEVTRVELAEHKRRGPPQWPPWSDVPSWLRKVIDRSLQPSSHARFSSVAALTGALAAPPTRVSRKWVFALGGAVAAGAINLGTGWDDASDPCRDGLGLRKSWSDNVQRVEQTLGGDSSRSRVIEPLDRYAQTLFEQQQMLCRTEGADERLSCLRERSFALSAAVDALLAGPAELRVRAVDVVHGLPSIRECEGWQEVAKGPLRRTRTTAALEKRLARVEAKARLGGFNAALNDAESLHADVVAHGEERLVARSHRLRGTLYVALGRSEDAVADLQEAMRIAARSSGREESSRAAIVLARQLASNPENRAKARALLESAVAAAAAEPPNPLLEAEALVVLGRLENLDGRHREARTALGRALELRVAMLGPESPALGEVLLPLATAQTGVGEFEDALAQLERALRVHEAAYGEQHPRVGAVHEAMALVHARQGRDVEAEASYRKAVAIYEASLGSDHPEVARVLGNLGALLLEQERFEESATALTRVFTIAQRHLEPGHPQVLRTLSNLAGAAMGLEQWNDARVTLEQAMAQAKMSDDREGVALVLGTLGTLHARRGHHRKAVASYEEALEQLRGGSRGEQVRRARIGVALGWVLQELGRYEDAASELRRAVELWGQTVPQQDHREAGLAWSWLGRAELERRNYEEALDAFEHAWTFAPALPPADRGDVAFELAKALWSDSDDDERAITLANEAATLYAAAGADYVRAERIVRRWIETRR